MFNAKSPIITDTYPSAVYETILDLTDNCREVAVELDEYDNIVAVFSRSEACPFDCLKDYQQAVLKFYSVDASGEDPLVYELDDASQYKDRLMDTIALLDEYEIKDQYLAIDVKNHNVSTHTAAREFEFLAYAIKLEIKRVGRSGGWVTVPSLRFSCSGLDHHAKITRLIGMLPLTAEYDRSRQDLKDIIKAAQGFKAMTEDFSGDCD